MEAIRVQQVIHKDGEITISDLPYRKGQFVEIIFLPREETVASKSTITVNQFRELELIGLWQDRDDIQDSSVYARQLREKAQKRQGVDYDLPG